MLLSTFELFQEFPSLSLSLSFFLPELLSCRLGGVGGMSSRGLECSTVFFRPGLRPTVADLPEFLIIL